MDTARLMQGIVAAVRSEELEDGGSDIAEVEQKKKVSKHPLPPWKPSGPHLLREWKKWKQRQKKKRGK